MCCRPSSLRRVPAFLPTLVRGLSTTLRRSRGMLRSTALATLAIASLHSHQRNSGVCSAASLALPRSTPALRRPRRARLFTAASMLRLLVALPVLVLLPLDRCALLLVIGRSLLASCRAWASDVRNRRSLRPPQLLGPLLQRPLRPASPRCPRSATRSKWESSLLRMSFQLFYRRATPTTAICLAASTLVLRSPLWLLAGSSTSSDCRSAIVGTSCSSRACRTLEEAATGAEIMLKKG
mmetsp:Transcript_58817/g.166947  ORF Transcript_58817/g.166947 Transcript_58817/m.166947 type:complete len:238 (+) Transcript_58817:110-823(+)